MMVGVSHSEGAAILGARLTDAVSDFLQERAYYSCLLLVHPDIRVLADTADALSEAYHWQRLSVGQELSAALLDVPATGYTVAARQWLEDRPDRMAPGPVLVTEIDLLFEPTLGLDPLALFRRASRTTRLVVAWPGIYVDRVLMYAVPQHAHHRRWPNPDVRVLSL